MEKVKLPKEIAEALDDMKHMGVVSIMAHIARFEDFDQTTPGLSLIHRYYKDNPFMIASAIVNGYEVEKTPEEQAQVLFEEHYAKIFSKGYKDYTESQICEAIEKTANFFGYKIDYSFDKE